MNKNSCTLMSALLRLGAGLVALAPGLVATPALAAPSGPPPTPVTALVTITEATYTPGGDLVGSVTHAPVEVVDQAHAAPELVAGSVPAATYTHAGGTSSPSGCRLLSVMKEGKTALGFTAYQFVNQTHWCWTRSSQRVYDVWTDWFLGKFDSNYYWRGIEKYVHLFYDYSTNDGHPRSAFKNLRIGRVDNCVLKYGCLAAIYPKVLIRSYYNGTYVWEIGG